MAINKDGLTSDLLRNLQWKVYTLEKYIDGQLREKHLPGRRLMIGIGSQLHRFVQNELQRLYSEQGWSVQFSYNFEKGHCIELS